MSNLSTVDLFAVRLCAASGWGLSGGQEVIVGGDVAVLRQIIQLPAKLIVATVVFSCLACGYSWL